LTQVKAPVASLADNQAKSRREVSEMDEKRPGGCQGSCPLGKVLGQRECPGKKAKERLVEWFRGEPKEGTAPEKPEKGR
jgi:hypothetical protein